MSFSTKSVRSVECTGCLDCLAVCPEADTLTVEAWKRRLGVPSFAAALLLLFFAGYIVALVSG